MTDLEQPTSPQDYASGFFGADYRSIGDTAWANWADPGDKYYRVRYGHNADDSPATQQEIDEAITQWNGFTRCQRWRIRLHHEALIRKQHESGIRVFVYYHSGIPVAKRDQIKQCTDPDEFEYLGGTFAAQCAKLNQRQAGLCSKFWANGAVDVVVFGWESDFGL